MSLRHGEGGRKPGRAVVAGHICVDIIPAFDAAHGAGAQLMVPGKLNHVGPAIIATGGTVSNTGLALHTLDVPVTLMGKVGRDAFGDLILSRLREYGGALADGMIVSPDSSSSYTVVINPPGIDRTFFHCPGANDDFRAVDVDLSALDDAALFHFGYPPLMRRFYTDGGAELSGMFRRCKERGVTTSLDMAKPDPESDAGRADWISILRATLPHVDVYLPSFDETLYMLDRTGYYSLESMCAGKNAAAMVQAEVFGRLADRLLDMGAAVVVLKLGNQGLYLRTTPNTDRLAAMGRAAPSNPEQWVDVEMIVPCFKTKVVGTTGSGDCTIAGFLAGLLRDMSPAQAMRTGVAVGSCNTEAADAVSGLRSWSQVCRRINDGWATEPVETGLDGWTFNEQDGVWSGRTSTIRKD